MTYIRHLARALSIYIASGAVPAMSAEVPPLEQLLETTVVSAAKRPQLPEQAPSMVSVITADTIRSFGWRTLSEAVASLPGVHVSYDRSYTYLGVRGVGRPGDYNSRVLLLIDGIPVNDAIYDQAPLGTEFPLDLALVDRIEYVPGAGSVMHGGNAFLAVINVITSSGARIGSRVQAAMGTGGASQLSASHGWRSESGLDGLLAVGRERQRGRDLFFDSYAAPGANAWSRGLDHDANDRVSLKLARGGLAGSLMLHERIKGVPGGSYGIDLDDPRNRVRDRRAVGSLRYDHQLSASTSWHVHGFALDYRYDGTYVYAGVAQPDALVTRSQGAEASLSSLVWRGHQVVAGISWRQDGVRRQFNPSLDTNTPRRSLGVFVQDDIQLGEVVTLSAGVRHDSITGPGTVSEVSPRLALIMQPRSGTVVKLIAGSAFRPPNGFETDYAFAGTNLANPGLRPERIATTELGLEQAFGTHGKLTASIYRNRMSDLVAMERAAATGLQQHRNVGQVEARGGDVEVATQLGAVALRGSFAWHRVRHESGAEVANTPRHSAKLLLTMPLVAATRLGLETYYTGRRTTDSGAIAVTGNPIGGHVVSHAAVTGNFWRGGQWQLRVSNLFDRRYSAVVGTEFSAAFPTTQVTPMTLVEQDGRAVFGSLRWQF